MKGKMIIVRPDDSVEVVWLSEKLSFQKIHDAVGGYIELIPYFTKYNEEDCVAFCDEEGKLKNLTYNRLASELWWAQTVTSMPDRDPMRQDYLVGNVVIIQGDKAFMKAL